MSLSLCVLRVFDDKSPLSFQLRKKQATKEQQRKHTTTNKLSSDEYYLPLLRPVADLGPKTLLQARKGESEWATFWY